jgi:perosamine synthetase
VTVLEDPFCFPVTINAREGGIILTNSKELRDKCYRLKNHGRDTKGIFKHSHIGFNFAFTEMQAAIGISQLKKLPKIIKKKQEIHNLYHSELSKISDKLKVIPLDGRTKPVWWFTSFLAHDKENLQKFLLKKGIQTRDFFYPLHIQPCYENMNISGDFSLSENVYNSGISFPSSYNLTNEEQCYIIKSILDFYERDHDTIS